MAWLPWRPCAEESAAFSLATLYLLLLLPSNKINWCSGLIQVFIRSFTQNQMERSFFPSFLFSSWEQVLLNIRLALKAASQVDLLY